MHRPQAVGLRAVLAGLLVLSLAPAAAVNAGRPVGHGPIRTPVGQQTDDAFLLARTAPEAVKAGTTDEACTGWRSTLFPPPTIRVLQTRGPNAGKVYRDPADPTGMTPLEIPFREYVGITMAAEWPAYYPPEVLKVGAIVVKQYSWYNTIVYRGGVDKDGLCYDVADNTTDQWYQPETRVPQASQLKAIAATWSMHVRKTDAQNGRSWFFRPGYRSGTNVPCGSDTDHFRIWQRSAFNCGKDGLDMEEILRKYLESRLEIVNPGRHDIVGDGTGTLSSEVGDISAVVEGGDGSLKPRIWQTQRNGISAAEISGVDLSGPGLLGFGSDDANGDGLDDLVIARQTGPTSIRLSVARSDGNDYLAPAGWWSGDLGADPDKAKLLVGDWNGDGRSDAALLLRTPKSTAELRVFARKKGNAYSAPVTWWSGPFDPATTSVQSGDVNGDGRNDLVLITDLGEAGRRFDIAYSTAASLVGGLGPLRSKFTAPDLVGDMVKVATGDVTRDGRDDLLLLIDAGNRTRIDILFAPKNKKAWTRREAWRSTTDGRLPFAKLKVATSDVDYDGLADLVVFRDRGVDGTEIMTWVTDFPKTCPCAYGTMTPWDDLTDPAEWSGLRPY